jgi:hypothetical protein
MAEGQATAPVAGTMAADPAFASFDAETQGAFKNKGWDVLSPVEAAKAAATSYREAEKFLGVPKDQIVRVPKDAADAEGWKALHTRLGVPADAKGYDFAGVKFADGSDLDASFIEAVAPALHAAGVAKDRAGEVIKAVVKFMDGAEATDLAESSAKLAQERDLVAKNWGPNIEANKFIVKQAVMKLGLPETVVDALEKTAGYSGTMNALLKIGQMMGEDKFVSTPAGGTPGVMTGEQAKALLTEKKADMGWVTKLNNGDVKVNQEFDALTRLMAAAGIS